MPGDDGQLGGVALQGGGPAQPWHSPSCRPHLAPVGDWGGGPHDGGTQLGVKGSVERASQVPSHLSNEAQASIKRDQNKPSLPSQPSNNVKHTWSIRRSSLSGPLC